MHFVSETRSLVQFAYTRILVSVAKNLEGDLCLTKPVDWKGIDHRSESSDHIFVFVILCIYFSWLHKLNSSIAQVLGVIATISLGTDQNTDFLHLYNAENIGSFYEILYNAADAM